MQPEFLSTIDAKTPLETPQVLLNWSFASPTTPITSGLSYLWEQIIIRRDDYKYPESITEGTSILSELYSTTPTTYKSDTSSLEALKEYYYSIFFKYLDHSSSPISIDQDIKRLFTVIYGVKYELPTILSSGTNGTTNIGSPIFTIPAPIPPALGFQGTGIEAGFVFRINDGGADDGYYTIVSVDSDTQVTLDTSPAPGLTVNTVGTCNFEVYTDHKKFWIGGINYDNLPILYRYDSKTQIVDYKIDLSSLLLTGETLTTVIHTGEKPGEIGIITKTRYISFTLMELPTINDIVDEWNLTGKLQPGYLVTGSCYSLLNDDIYLLDSTHKEIVSVDVITEATVITIDLSGLDDVTFTSLRGLALDTVGGGGQEWLIVGNGNYIYYIPDNVIPPLSSDVEMIVYARDMIETDITYYKDLLTSDQYIGVICDYTQKQKLKSYSQELGRGYLWQQPFVSDLNTVALYHLDTDGIPNVIDTSSHGFNGINNGMIPEQSGRFSYGYEATAINQFINIIAIAPIFNAVGEQGSISIWFKVTNDDDLIDPINNRYMCWFEVNPGNYVYIGIVSGLLTFTYMAGGVLNQIQAPHPFVDENWHNYKITWDAFISGVVTAYVDGVVFQAPIPIVPAWAGVLNLASIGEQAVGETLLGTYDEVRISDIERVVHTPVYGYTDANKCHTFSGRDYSTGYVDGERLTFHYRDQLYTPRFTGGDYLINEDYESDTLFPPNKEAYDGSVIFRDSNPPKIGDFGRTIRIIGGIFDRICEERERLLDYTNEYKIDSDYLNELASYLGIPGLDTNWNIDKQRRYINVMRNILRKGGVKISYIVYARLLGFLITETTQYARRLWDSVVDPNAQDVYLDEMGSMDTGDQYYPLAFLNFLIYKQVASSAVGDTTVALTLTDATATFRDYVSIGDLVKVMDVNTSGDNGEYVVTQVLSDTAIMIGNPWPIGGQTNLDYKIGTKVTKYDPYVDYLFSRFLDIQPFCVSSVSL